MLMIVSPAVFCVGVCACRDEGSTQIKVAVAYCPKQRGFLAEKSKENNGMEQAQTELSVWHWRLHLPYLSSLASTSALDVMSSLHNSTLERTAAHISAVLPLQRVSDFSQTAHA
jgi:hypothetical protein